MIEHKFNTFGANPVGQHDIIPAIRRALALAFVIFALVVFLSRLHSVQLYNWTYGEWLIHYGNGFVRRGLSGELILFITNLFGFSLDTVVRYNALLLVSVALALSLLIIPRLNLAQVFWLCFGPCLLFPTVYDPTYYGRKDVVSVIVLLLHCTVLLYRRDWAAAFQIFILPVLLVFSILVHEVQFFVLPFHIFLIYSLGPNTRYAAIMLNIVLPTAAFLMVMIYSGRPEDVTRICVNIGRYSQDIYQRYCVRSEWELLPGPILNLSRNTLDEQLNDQLMFVFRNRIAFQAYTLLYVISIGITLLLFRSTVDNLRKNKSLLTLLITANTFILFPIFMSSDLGRWIVLFCLHSFVVLAYLSVSERRQEPINLLILAAVIVTSALVYIQHWAKNLRSFSDIIQSRLSEAWGDGLSYFVSLLKTISDTI